MRVDNFDQLNEYERRQHQIYDVSLGTRGLPVRGLVYFAVLGAANWWLLGNLGIAGVVARAGAIEALVLLPTLYVGLPGALAFVAVSQMPGGLAAHQLIIPAFNHYSTPRHLLGWVGVPRTRTRWFAPDLVVEPSISDRETPHVKLTGPAEMFVGNEYARQNHSSRPLRRRGSAASFVVGQEIRAEGPRAVKIPSGVTVEIRGADK